jgi:[methyl-Co(III) methanol-specific corrinoid protein]:coenzyme M methyltransferase
MTVEAEAMGAKVAMGSSFIEPHVIEYVIDSVNDYQKLKPLDVTKGRSQVVIDAIKLLKADLTDVPIIGNLTGPISVASSIMEPTTFYKQLKKKNVEAHKYMEFVTEQLITFGRAMIEAGVDVIAISEPSGTGEILGPRYFNEFVVKYLNYILDELNTDNVSTIVHICGQMKSVYKEIAQVNSNVLSFDAVVSIEEAKHNLPNHLIMGNISTYALEFQEPSSIKALTNNCIRKGSDIIAPACGLGMKTPLINIQEIISTLNDSKL